MNIKAKIKKMCYSLRAAGWLFIAFFGTMSWAIVGLLCKLKYKLFN
jgi:hypothetical protein